MKTHTWSLLTLVILAFLFGETVCSIQADNNTAVTQEILDQSQEKRDYGFLFDSNGERWQEFVPTFNNMTALELYLYKLGDPGTLHVEIRNLDGDVLFFAYRAGSALTSGWVRFDLPAPINLTPGEKYRIVVTSDQPATSDSRYIWYGSNQSEYRSDCDTDVTSGWPDFHYAFRTYGQVWPLFLPVILKS